MQRVDILIVEDFLVDEASFDVDLGVENDFGVLLDKVFEGVVVLHSVGVVFCVGLDVGFFDAVVFGQ